MGVIFAFSLRGVGVYHGVARRAMSLYDQISESTFTAQIVQMCIVFGWRVMHQRPARTKTGWRTAIVGHAGFPDIIALRHDRRLIAELKAGRGKVTVEQEKWLGAAKDADFEVYIWKPKDIDQIERILR